MDGDTASQVHHSEHVCVHTFLAEMAAMDSHLLAEAAAHAPTQAQVYDSQSVWSRMVTGDLLDELDEEAVALKKMYSRTMEQLHRLQVEEIILDRMCAAGRDSAGHAAGLSERWGVSSVPQLPNVSVGDHESEAEAGVANTASLGDDAEVEVDGASADGLPALNLQLPLAPIVVARPFRHYDNGESDDEESEYGYGDEMGVDDVGATGGADSSMGMDMEVGVGSGSDEGADEDDEATTAELRRILQRELGSAGAWPGDSGAADDENESDGGGGGDYEDMDAHSDEDAG